MQDCVCYKYLEWVCGRVLRYSRFRYFGSILYTSVYFNYKIEIRIFKAFVLQLLLKHHTYS